MPTSVLSYSGEPKSSPQRPRSKVPAPMGTNEVDSSTHTFGQFQYSPRKPTPTAAKSAS